MLSISNSFFCYDKFPVLDHVVFGAVDSSCASLNVPVVDTKLQVCVFQGGKEGGSRWEKGVGKFVTV